jgi:hypothetical protein
MLCEQCSQPFRGEKPPGYKEIYTGSWRQGPIEDVGECVICLRVWRLISIPLGEDVQYSISRELRIRNNDMENQMEGIWATYNITIRHGDNLNDKKLYFSLKSFSSKILRFGLECLSLTQ